MVVPESLLKNYNKLSQIVANSIPDHSYQLLTNDEKTIMDIAKKHIEIIEATLCIQNEACCHILHNRITTAAILEHTFNKFEFFTPNISIIHELVNHYNPAGQHCYMPLKLLKLISKDHQEIDMSKVTTKDTIITFTRANTTASLACTIDTNIIIHYKGKNEKLLCKLDFTITSQDRQNFSEVQYKQNFSEVQYKSIFFELFVPDTINTHIPSMTDHYHSRSDHLISILSCIPDVQVDNNNYTHVTYSVPNLQPPLLIRKQNFNTACGLASTSIENYQHTTQQHC